MGRYLKGNKSSELPSHIISVDVESYINKLDEKDKLHTFRLGTYWYLRRNKLVFSKSPGEFYKIENFWKTIDNYIKPHRTLYLIGHNMRYDYGILNLDEYLSSRGFVIEKFVIEQVFIVSAIKDNNIQLVIIDSKNWFPMKLEKLGKAFGMDKGEISDFENVTNEELLPYCYNDSLIVAEVVIKVVEFITEHNLGNFCVTSAGLAFNGYRHRFMPEKTIVIHGIPEFYDLEQKTYRGGRTDIFRYGFYYNIIKLDINSMYPYVMKFNDYPVAPLSRWIINDSSIDDLKEFCFKENCFVIADCDIKIIEPSIAIKREKLIFPIGKIKNAYLTNPEINYLLESELINKVNSLLIYKSQNIFNEYVDYFFNIKTNSDGPIKEFAKLFLNTPYGKFGQRKFGEINEYNNTLSKQHFDLSPDNDVYFEHQTGNKIMKIGNSVYSVSPKLKTPSYNSSPVIASAVTAYARMYLWKLFKICGIENLYYCDTDSIFTNRIGYENLDNGGYIDNKLLGKLKLEGIGDIDIRGPKDYDWYECDGKREYKRTIKGIPQSAKEIAPGKFVYDQWVTGLNRYKTGKIDGIKIKQIEKVLSRNYDKGIIDKDGTVRPLTFNEW